MRVKRAGETLPEPRAGMAMPGGTRRETEVLEPQPGNQVVGARSVDAYVDESSYATENADAVVEPAEEGNATATELHEDQVKWQDRALRLQAEMENYRRRQKRLAQDQIETERERLLKAFVEVIDDLERALASPSGDGGGLREGVQLTYRAALQRLKREGAEQIEAQGQRFDPAWHEAVSTLPSRQLGAAPETVVQVLEPGYRLGDRLLRPARVVVAV